MNSLQEYVLEAKGIVKTFPGVVALNGVNLSIKKGEVHAIAGENGAGKSTLMLILGGIYPPDEGELYIEGKRVVFHDALEAQKHGIGIVYQELSLVPALSIAENIYANRQPVNKLNLIKRKELYEKTTEMLSLFNMQDIDPSALVKDLSIANQQVVEILKAMSLKPKVLILDEPTSSLTDIEAKRLFAVIRILKEQGVSLVYISHHLNEIFELADRVTVLRDGQYVCEECVTSIDEDYLVTHMVGRKIENMFSQKSGHTTSGQVLFEARNISRKNTFHDISFEVKEGEIVSMSGLIGAGRTEIGRAIFGAEPIESGTLYLHGEKISIRNTCDAIHHGIGYMSEDRKTMGLYMNFTIRENLISNKLQMFTKRGFLRLKNVESYVQSQIDDFNIITPSAAQLINNLSGGNQQKVLLATWFGIAPKLLIVDEPTRGVDVGAKSEIYSLLRKLAAQGVGVLMISSDLQEVLGISDRILVVKDGRLTGNVLRAEASEERILALMTGMTEEAEEELR